MDRPGRDEYAEYYHTYVGKVPGGDIVDILGEQRDEIEALVRGIPEARGGYRYADGKWTVKDVVGHVVDTERVFGYRMLAFARGDQTPLPSMEQDDYVAGGNFAARTLASLADEFAGLRASHVALVRSFDDAVSVRRGTASGVEFTVRALAYILAGHARHHAGVLRERYL
jgi:hypothetical protein